MVRSQKIIGGIVGVAVGKAPYKIGDRTVTIGQRVLNFKCIPLSSGWGILRMIMLLQLTCNIFVEG